MISSATRSFVSSRSVPQVPYEQVGDVPNVVFPCAALVDDAADRVAIYYGAADTVTCLAYAHLSELVAFARGD